MTTPTWYSLDQIVGQMSMNFISRLDSNNIVPGIQDLKPGSPFLSIFQAVGMSRMLDQQQMMEVLDANNIDSPSANLDRIGASINAPRLGQTYSTGLVNITDTSFTKIATNLYQGTPNPIPGTTTIYVLDGSKFTSTGNIYIGRGTNNYEGPVGYGTLTNTGSGYWSMTLTSPLQNYHSNSETVILAQGGNRSINSGQSFITSQNGSQASISFSATQSVVIPDGEVAYIGLPIIAQVPGSTGNVATGAINSSSSPAFPGMTVTNDNPINNGRDAETDVNYKARIKAIKASSGLGTQTAIETNALGITSPDESSYITQATLVKQNSRPTVLIIDDGSFPGYEEKTEGINYEIIMDSANGGETSFELVYGRPVAKANVETNFEAPFQLTSGSLLAVLVGGVHYEHVFLSSDFQNINNATAYEVVNSINSDLTIPFNARTSNNGLNVVIFADVESDEFIQVTTPYSGVDANTELGFPISEYDTLYLYKNNKLLNKDGTPAKIDTSPQTSWSVMTSPQTLIINVDNTGYQTYSFSDSDFINSNTGFLTLSSQNSLTAWAAVINNKIPGITATINGAIIELTSNKGNSSLASINVLATSTLAVNGMFNSLNLSSIGKSYDYSLNRNLGQIELVTPLSPGDSLSAGSLYTRAYIQSQFISSSVTIPATANLWFAVDGAATLISTGLASGTTITPSTSLATNGSIVTFTSSVPGVFLNLKAGDWFILTTPDMGLPVGQWRVSNVDPAGTYFTSEIDWDTLGYVFSVSSTSVFNEIKFARSNSLVQHLTIAPGTYTIPSIPSLLNIKGATTTVYNTNYIQVTTNTYDNTGDISLLAQDINASVLLFSVGLSQNSGPHIASAASGNKETGTPNFNVSSIYNYSAGVVTAASNIITDYKEGMIDELLFIRPPPVIGQTLNRFSNLDSVNVPVLSITSPTSFSLDSLPSLPIGTLNYTSYGDYAVGVSAYRLGPQSYLNIILNNNPAQNTFNVPMFRDLVADPSVSYGSTIRLKDQDLLTSGSPSNLSSAFGTGFDFSNFALHAQGRGITHPSDTTKSVLWRKNSDYSGVLTTSNVRYTLPSSASSAVKVSDSAQSAVISSITRSGSTVTATLAIPTASLYFFQNMEIYVNISSVNFSTGYKTITSVSGNTISWTEAGAVATESPTGATASFVNSINLALPSGAPLTNNLISGEILYYDSPTNSINSGYPISSITRSGSTVTATLTGYASVVGGTGMNIGTTVYINISSVNFTAGYKTVTANSPISSTISWTEAGSAVTETPINALSSWSLNVYLFQFGQSAILSGFNNYWGYTGTSTVMEKYPYNSIYNFMIATPNPGWTTGLQTVGSSTDFTAYKIDDGSGSLTAASLVNLVSLSNLVYGTVLGTGAGLINLSGGSNEDTAASAALVDGILQISSSTYDPVSQNYNLSLKWAPDSSLVSAPNNDYAHETFKLVPTTLKNITSYLSTPAITGIATPTVAEVVTTGLGSILPSDQNLSLQVSTNTIGSAGGVQITGGTANNFSYSVSGAASTFANKLQIPITATSDPLDAGLRTVTTKSWAKFTSSITAPKLFKLNSLNSIQFLAGNKVVFAQNGGPIGSNYVWTHTGSPVLNLSYYIQKQGRFAAYSNQSVANVNIGDWVVISSGTGNISLANTGTFRVVNVSTSSNTFWVDNPNSINETATVGSVYFYQYDSMMPGDQITIGNSSLPNQGIWTVSANDGDGAVGHGGDQGTFYVTGAPVNSSAVVLGSNYVYISAKSAAPVTSYGRILEYSQTSSSIYVDNIDYTRPYLISSSLGSTFQSLDRLNFSNNLVVGQDAYQHDIGLIAAANQVLYGDEQNPLSYPGVISAGDNIYIAPPLIKRVQISVAVRQLSGIDTTSAVQAAIAAVIQNSGGKPIVISEYISAAQNVPGVISVIPINPVPVTGSDVISVQPGEKAAILDINSDVLVSIIGNA